MTQEVKVVHKVDQAKPAQARFEVRWRNGLWQVFDRHRYDVAWSGHMLVDAESALQGLAWAEAIRVAQQEKRRGRPH